MLRRQYGKITTIELKRYLTTLAKRGGSRNNRLGRQIVLPAQPGPVGRRVSAPLSANAPR